MKQVTLEQMKIYFRLHKELPGRDLPLNWLRRLGEHDSGKVQPFDQMTRWRSAHDVRAAGYGGRDINMSLLPLSEPSRELAKV